jgi:microcystin-dependent protein
MSIANAGAIAVPPTGAVIGFAADTAPTGWLLCYGQSLLRTDYDSLFGVIGTTYGSADGTHFNLPDLRGRVPAGQDDMGGSSANRLTAAQAEGIDGDVLGGTGGEEGHTLAAVESGTTAHAHGIGTLAATQAAHSHAPGGSGTTFYGGVSSGANLVQPGAGSAWKQQTSTDSQTPAITVTGAPANSTAAAAANAHNNVQPTIILNYIIKT